MISLLMLCIVVYISHCPPSTVSADSGYPFLLCFYFCPEMCIRDRKNDTDRVLALYGSADERYW